MAHLTGKNRPGSDTQLLQRASSKLTDDAEVGHPSSQNLVELLQCPRDCFGKEPRLITACDACLHCTADNELDQVT